jgi:hypothetical protein
MLYVDEGMNNSVAVSQDYATGVRNFHISGKIEASSDSQDMRLQRMLGVDCRLRRRRDGRNVHTASVHRENHDL